MLFIPAGLCQVQQAVLVPLLVLFVGASTGSQLWQFTPANNILMLWPQQKW